MKDLITNNEHLFFFFFFFLVFTDIFSENKTSADMKTFLLVFTDFLVEKTEIADDIRITLASDQTDGLRRLAQLLLLSSLLWQERSKVPFRKTS